METGVVLGLATGDISLGDIIAGLGAVLSGGAAGAGDNHAITPYGIGENTGLEAGKSLASGTNTSSADQKAGPVKAADAPGVTAGGQATDEHGNKLGPSGKPQVNTTKSNTREAANNKALDGGSQSVEHSNPKKGNPHFHPADSEGNKKPASTHHEYPE